MPDPFLLYSLPMADIKTTPNDGNVLEFLNSVEHERRRKDGLRLLEIMREETGLPPLMWGNSIVGFGSYHYKYASGREGNMLRVGFSPRKQNLTLYIAQGFEGCEALLEKLGPHKTSKACLYITRLENVDENILRTLIQKTLVYMEERYGK